MAPLPLSLRCLQARAVLALVSACTSVPCPWTRRGHQGMCFLPGDPSCPLWGEAFAVRLLAPTRKLSLEAWPRRGIPPGHCGPPRCRCLSSEGAACVCRHRCSRPWRWLCRLPHPHPPYSPSLVQYWYRCPPGQLPQLLFISGASWARSKALEKRRPSALDTGVALAPVGKQKLVMKFFPQVQA